MRRLTDFAGPIIVMAAVVVALLFANGCNTFAGKDVGLEYRIAANNVLLVWEQQDNAFVYLVQGRYMDGDWDDLSPTYVPNANVRVNMGMFQFRVVGYNKMGKVFESRPTARIFMRPNAPNLNLKPNGGRNFNPDGPRQSMWMSMVAPDSTVG